MEMESSTIRELEARGKARAEARAKARGARKVLELLLRHRLGDGFTHFASRLEACGWPVLEQLARTVGSSRDDAALVARLEALLGAT